MIRNASAVWTGDLKGGHGAISTPGKALDNTQYSFSSRFEEGVGTNPEELIAAAHAGCYSMALTAFLNNGGFAPESVSTTANVSLDNVEGAGWTITKIHLDTTAVVPGIDAEKFAEIAADAKAKCPISRVLAAAEITLDAKLG
jgi:lipoyl-dependent peroxiredoxin